MKRHQPNEESPALVAGGTRQDRHEHETPLSDDAVMALNAHEGSSETSDGWLFRRRSSRRSRYLATSFGIVAESEAA
jgi:hypothetical protein